MILRKTFFVSSVLEVRQEVSFGIRGCKALMYCRKSINIYIKILVAFLMINYQVVTVLFDDFFLLKYFRDILLIAIIILMLSQYQERIVYSPIYVAFLLFLVFLFLAILNTSSINAIFVFLRRYLFPFMILFIMFFPKKQKLHLC